MRLEALVMSGLDGLETWLSRPVPLWWLGALLAFGILAWRWRGRRLHRLEARARHGSRVRGGHLAESLAPLLEDFPVDPAKPGVRLVFLGQPVDYIAFDPDDGVTFIEIKSGGARLSVRQAELKRRVEEGRVRWVDYTVR